jgi:hypothetical protein
MDEAVIRCEECQREVDEFTAAAENWHFWLDGRDLLPYCPDCSERELGGETTEAADVEHPRARSKGY